MNFQLHPTDAMTFVNNVELPIVNIVRTIGITHKFDSIGTCRLYRFRVSGSGFGATYPYPRRAARLNGLCPLPPLELRLPSRDLLAGFWFRVSGFGFRVSGFGFLFLGDG